MKNKIIASVMAVFLAFTPAAAVLAEETDAEVLMIEESVNEVLAAGTEYRDSEPNEIELIESIEINTTTDAEHMDDQVEYLEAADEMDDFLLDVEEVDTKIYDSSAKHEMILGFVITEKLEAAGEALNAAPSYFSMFNNTVFSGTYGAQLCEDSKVVYDAMVDTYVTNWESGELRPTIELKENEELKFTVAELPSTEEALEEMKSSEAYQAAAEPFYCIMQSAHDAFVYDYPEVAWMGRLIYSISFAYEEQEDGTYELYFHSVVLKPEDKYEGASSEIAEFHQSVNLVAENLEREFASDISREHKIKEIHDYLCDVIVYTDLKSDEDKSDHSAAGVFLKGGKVVCEGYAKAFKILCNEFGIECVLIPGEVPQGPHMWNYVKMEDENWYMVDVTWDDGTIVDYNYFLKGSADIPSSRVAYTNFSNSLYAQNFVLPELNNVSYTRTHQFKYISNNDAAEGCSGTETQVCTYGCGTKGRTTCVGEHSFTDYVYNEDATCQGGGTKTAKCDYCDETSTIDDLESIGKHSFTQYKSNGDATCQGGGTKTAKCDYCDVIDTIEDTISIGEHSWKTEKTIDRESTCTVEGSKSIHCKNCNMIQDGSEEKLSLKAHSFTQYKSNGDATCQGGGTKTAKCDYCDETDTIEDTITIGQHSWKTEKTVDKVPTCMEAGSKSTYCSLCSEMKEGSTESIFALAHVFENYKFNNDATVLTDGTKTACCERGCGVSNTITASGTKLKPTYKVTAKNIKLKVGQSTSKIKITDLAAGDSVKSWVSSNKNVVTVSKAGKIKGIKKGTAYVTVTLVSKEKIKIKVTVQKSAVKTTAITGLKKNLTIKKGKKETLTPVLKPITSVETITYTTSNKKVAAVSKKGIITAKAAGKAKITVKAGTKKFVVTVTVPQTKTTGIKNIPKTVSLNLKKKKTYQLKAKILPANSDQKITYSTSKKSVASVSKTGKITAKKKGTTIIKVKSGSKTVECRVTVK